MAFIVVYDACVLFPAPLRDLLVRLGMVGLFRARWTERILDECFRNILHHRPDLRPEQLARSRSLLEQAIPDGLVRGSEPLIEGIRGLPDPDDRHVLAAAIRCSAQLIVTFNLKDFPARVLSAYDVEARHPDDFVLDVIDLDGAAVARVLREQAAALRSPPRSVHEVLALLRQQGLRRSVTRLTVLLEA
ncbi:PIN domain-containing protein [Myxococcus stipitatus]|uniref:PIN domain-containing protein n=1 Tax=Myxococcus stipitatus TaxID=83455 RepID=UPI001F1920EA|nr:PIN domain-containing protein [Myxococcus stipitatus]MCE9668338.1 PIN domain-containing protein [Myxococcus stipitatus]